MQITFYNPSTHEYDSRAYQWETNVTMRFRCYNLEEPYVALQNKITTEAVVVKATRATVEFCECRVPDFMLTVSDKIYAYVTDMTEGINVVDSGYFEVVARQKPVDYASDDDPEAYSLRTLIAQAEQAGSDLAAEVAKIPEVIASIPADYSELSNNVSQLSESIVEIQNDIKGLDLVRLDDGKIYISINGVAIGEGLDIGSPTDPIEDIDTVVEWYKSEVYKAVNYVKSLGEGYVHHVVMTDMHYNANYRHSANIANVLMKTGLFDKFMLLGDLTDGGNEAGYTPFIEDGFAKNNGKILLALGNHDVGMGATIPYSTYYNDFISELDGASEEFYYYVDDVSRKIRYIVLNSEAYTETQNNYLIEKLNLPSDWVVFVLIHRNLVFDSGVNWSGNMNSAKSAMIMNALKQSPVPIGGYICGHQHHDLVSLLDNSFYHVTLANDKNETYDYYPGYSITTRTSKTTFEQAITLMSINPTTKDVKFYRIGAFKNAQRFSYNYDVTAPVEITEIEAEYSGSDVPVGASLETLRNNLVVTAIYSNGQTEVVSDYLLSGTIGTGVNSITVSYYGKTTTFNVTGVEIPEGNLINLYDFVLVDKQCTHEILSEISIKTSSPTNSTTRYTYILVHDLVPGTNYSLTFDIKATKDTIGTGAKVFGNKTQGATDDTGFGARIVPVSAPSTSDIEGRYVFEFNHSATNKGGIIIYVYTNVEVRNMILVPVE